VGGRAGHLVGEADLSYKRLFLEIPRNGRGVDFKKKDRKKGSSKGKSKNKTFKAPGESYRGSN